MPSGIVQIICTIKSFIFGEWLCLTRETGEKLSFCTFYLNYWVREKGAINTMSTKHLTPKELSPGPMQFSQLFTEWYFCKAKFLSFFCRKCCIWYHSNPTYSTTIVVPTEVKTLPKCNFGKLTRSHARPERTASVHSLHIHVLGWISQRVCTASTFTCQAGSPSECAQPAHSQPRLDFTASVHSLHIHVPGWISQRACTARTFTSQAGFHSERAQPAHAHGSLDHTASVHSLHMHMAGWITQRACTAHTFTCQAGSHRERAQPTHSHGSLDHTASVHSLHVHMSGWRAVTDRGRWDVSDVNGVITDALNEQTGRSAETYKQSVTVLKRPKFRTEEFQIKLLRQKLGVTALTKPTDPDCLFGFAPPPPPPHTHTHTQTHTSLVMTLITVTWMRQQGTWQAPVERSLMTSPVRTGISIYPKSIQNLTDGHMVSQSWATWPINFTGSPATYCWSTCPPEMEQKHTHTHTHTKA